ncbi:MAG: hypothetical protein DI586_07620 [Micavibrio aeruginosavorus]|uniref:Uncharacterized protein n=1 Tax=Micavibrio aeruginosavorus TaxID=349221 RepID=A0A2W5HHS0_9BACT|nr:MAG: hypothetical protein DI586_07620 [Micavibrio aeruginosavorus]
MDKKSTKDHLDYGIQTGIAPTPQHAQVAAQTARQNVKLTGQDEKAGPVKAAAQNSDKDKQEVETGLGIGALTMLEMLNKTRTDLEGNSLKLLSFDQLLQKGDLDQEDIFSADTSDARVRDMEVGEYIDEQTGERHYYTGETLSRFRGTHRELPLGPDNFKMKSVGQVQIEMVSAIQKAASLTGVPASLLGAMAGKETRLGQGGMVSPTGAIGLFQQTGGYREAFWNSEKNRAFVANHVAEARQYLSNDGKIDSAEARKLAWNPEASALMTAIRAQELARAKGFNLNDRNTWTYVYTEHNAGRGSLNKLMNGQMTDSWIRDYNPAVYGGKNTAADVLAGSDRDMKLWANRFEKLTSQLGMDASSPPTQSAASTPVSHAKSLVAEASHKAQAIAEAPAVKSAFHAASNATSSVVHKGVEMASTVAHTISDAASGFWNKIKPSVFGA